ncbi:MAG: DNA gyrase subunit A [Erysipelotrichaceae bacterium]|jgi:DNA gyrase subunit A|nr:DNA gyrase subunit A [Bacilli bacterium]NLV29337.1 DNA gyrase subunit A [Erysipelotrichaceae bacterium]HPY79736.1 DNA gyrase subunit A [Bacilli bacterium]HQA55624.1 DNA gyrase subunit A [Bacilli bacterium]
MLFEDEKKLEEAVEVVAETEEVAEAPNVSDEELEKIEEGIVPGLTDVGTAELVQTSFLDYAMSVIVSRALPDVRDGLKPVHRRIVYSLDETGTTPDKPFKKCARIVGDVMGKYHPHGDSAIYGALVRLAQPFSMRYMLVEGHGNFGSIDGDEPAAYRYTEARMAKLALEMVRDISCDTVDFMDNYDGVDREPTVLPARFPNLLVNGSAGIAVGMATNMPPHNLTEVIDGVIALAHNPEITIEELMEHIKGPDFPTGATILGRSGIRDAYESGTGSIAVRSKCEIEDRGDRGLKRIVVSEIPYGVNKALMIENIANLARDKVIDGITDIRDESNKEGIRVVIEVRRDIIPEVLLNQLFKMTQLQTSYGIINLCLVDNAPKVCSLKELLTQYLDFRVEIIRRRTQFLLAKDEARDHIVIGLIKCHDNIDEIVDLIKASETPEEASDRLKEKFGFSDAQVQAILGMNLRRLTGIETEKLQAERAQLELNIKEYNRILSARENQIEVVIKELKEIEEKFGDDRRTEISNAASSIDDEDLIPEEQIVITLSRGGYVKRLTADSFRAQNRGGRGVRGTTLNENDVVDLMVYTKTHTDLLFFTSLGKVYRVRGYQIPEYQKTGKGIPVVNIINVEKGEVVKAIIACDEYREDRYLFFVTEKGLIKKTYIKEYESIRQNGKIAIGLREDDMLLAVREIEENTIVGIAASNGKMVNFFADETRPMGRSASGVKGIDLVDGETVVGVTTELGGNKILVLTDKGFGKMTDRVDEEGNQIYRLTKRGAKGVSTLKITDKVGKLVAVRAVNGDEDLMVITNAGIVIRTHLDQIRTIGRNTQGVKIMNLEGRQKVVSIAIVPREDDLDEDCGCEEVDVEDNNSEQSEE